MQRAVSSLITQGLAEWEQHSQIIIHARKCPNCHAVKSCFFASGVAATSKQQAKNHSRKENEDRECQKA